MRKMFLFIIIVFFIGCATSAKSFNQLKLGMKKSEVTSIMGTPSSTAAQKDNEYLNYVIKEYNAYYEYYVRLIGGVVESFGKRGDFDSTKTQENTVNLNVNSLELKK